MTDEATIYELHEALRQREALLNEASALLAGGSGEDSPEYEEFLRLRKELPQVSRTPELDHCLKMVRSKTKELRKWLCRMDRSLGTTDPVTGIIDYIQSILPRYQHAPHHEAKCLTDLLVAIENGDWIEKIEGAEPVQCKSCGDDYADESALLRHCTHSTCRLG